MNRAVTSQALCNTVEWQSYFTSASGAPTNPRTMVATLSTNLLQSN